MDDKIRQRATIKEIARCAGTSIATVSRVLRSVEYPVSPQLRDRVLQATRELNYTPNLVGRFLKNNSSNDIGVIIPNISNPFYPLLVLGIEAVFEQYGFNMLLCNSFRDENKEMQYVELLKQKQVKGMIIASISCNRDYLQQQIDAGLHVVTFDQSVEDLICNKVVIDYEQGSNLAMEHLIANGHRDIGFISAPLTRVSRRLICQGYAKTLQAHQIPMRQRWLYIAETETEKNGELYEFENGKRLATQLAKSRQRPTAVMVINDMTAYGLMRELSNHKIRVPEDLSVVSFDNIFFSQVTNPPLTTIGYSTYDMGRMAAECLIHSMTGEQSETASIVIKPQLIVRNSVRTL